MREQALQAARRARRATHDYVDSPYWQRTPLPATLSTSAARCRRKFLHLFPHGFVDSNYDSHTRQPLWRAHAQWEWLLDRETFHDLLRASQFVEIAARATRIVGRTPLLSSREKTALHEAVRAPDNARQFAEGLFTFLHGRGSLLRKFAHWCSVLAHLPRRNGHSPTWPMATVFGFLAQPALHLFLKPSVCRAATKAYNFSLSYRAEPNAETYSALLEFATAIRGDFSDLGPAAPRDMIDVYAFMRVQMQETGARRRNL